MLCRTNSRIGIDLCSFLRFCLAPLRGSSFTRPVLFVGVVFSCQQQKLCFDLLRLPFEKHANETKKESVDSNVKPPPPSTCTHTHARTCTHAHTHARTDTPMLLWCNSAAHTDPCCPPPLAVSQLCCCAPHFPFLDVSAKVVYVANNLPNLLSFFFFSCLCLSDGNADACEAKAKEANNG